MREEPQPLVFVDNLLRSEKGREREEVEAPLVAPSSWLPSTFSRALKPQLSLSLHQQVHFERPTTWQTWILEASSIAEASVVVLNVVVLNAVANNVATGNHRAPRSMASRRMFTGARVAACEIRWRDRWLAKKTRTCFR